MSNFSKKWPSEAHSPEDMEQIRHSLQTFARNARAARRRWVKTAMLQAVRESNQDKTFTIDILAAVSACTQSVRKELQEALRPVEISPTSRGERKRAGALDRRRERLRSRKGQL
jgi:hypothetical protein